MLGGSEVYGVFVQNVLALLIVAAAMFVIVRVVIRIDEARDEETDDAAPVSLRTK